MTVPSIPDFDNTKVDLTLIAAVANSSALTATDRMGNTRRTLAGINADAQDAIDTIKAFNNRGAWAASTVYAVKDLVSQGGVWYVAVVPHTSSAAFATDQASKWRVYQGVTAGELSAANGGGLVGFALSELGAVTRTMLAKASESVSVLDFGADRTGATDSDVAFSAAKATGKAIHIPQGTYVISPIIFTANVFGDGAEKSILKAKAGSTGTLVSLQSTSGQYSTKLSDVQLLANGTGQSGLKLLEASGTVERVRLQNFDTVGMAFGDGATGAYWCRAAEMFIVMAGGTGVQFASGVVNANANECQNVYICGTFTTGLDMGGRGNRFMGGTVEWRAGCVDVIKSAGQYNLVDSAYIEAIGGAQPTRLLNLTGNHNTIRNLLLQATLTNSLYSKIVDTGRGNNIEIPQNLRFVSASRKSKKNYWPNAHFRLWKGANQPFGYTNIGAGATKDSAVTFAGSPTLKMSLAANFLQANCHFLLGANSDVDYPLEAFQGKTVSIAVACRTALAGYGGLTYTIVAPSGNINGAANNSHTGGGGWEIFSTSFRVPDDATAVFATLRSHETNAVGTGDVWWGEPTLTFGSEALYPGDGVLTDDSIFRTDDLVFYRDGSVEGDSPMPFFHGRYVWGDSLGALRQSANKPADLETGGNPLGRKVAVPGTATTAGVPGDWAADASYFYAYTGDGSTHAWRRVAVAAW